MAVIEAESVGRGGAAPERARPSSVIGECHYCGQPLYACQPTSELDEPLSHVACAVHARRTGQRV